MKILRNFNGKPYLIELTEEEMMRVHREVELKKCRNSLETILDEAANALRNMPVLRLPVGKHFQYKAALNNKDRQAVLTRATKYLAEQQQTNSETPCREDKISALNIVW